MLVSAKKVSWMKPFLFLTRFEDIYPPQSPTPSPCLVGIREPDIYIVAMAAPNRLHRGLQPFCCSCRFFFGPAVVCVVVVCVVCVCVVCVVCVCCVLCVCCVCCVCVLFTNACKCNNKKVSCQQTWSRFSLVKKSWVS